MSGSSSRPSSGSASSRTPTETRPHFRDEFGGGTALGPSIGPPDRHPRHRPVGEPEGILPLRRDLAKIAVIGPNARSIRNLFGGYSAANVIEMLTNGDMGLPAPVLDGESVLPSPSLTESNDDQPESEGTGKDFGFVRRIATRPSETSLAAIDAVYADTPTVLSAIESIVADGTEVVFALGCHVNDPSTQGIPEAVAAAIGLRRGDRRPRRQDRVGRGHGGRRNTETARQSNSPEHSEHCWMPS